MGFILKNPKKVFKSYKSNEVRRASSTSNMNGSYYYKEGKHLYNKGKDNKIYTYYSENGKIKKYSYYGG